MSENKKANLLDFTVRRQRRVVRSTFSVELNDFIDPDIVPEGQVRITRCRSLPQVTLSEMFHSCMLSDLDGLEKVIVDSESWPLKSLKIHDCANLKCIKSTVKGSEGVLSSAEIKNAPSLETVEAPIRDLTLGCGLDKVRALLPASSVLSPPSELHWHPIPPSFASCGAFSGVTWT